MAVILLWMSPEPGHLLPTIKIARDLRRHGHTVIYQVPVFERKRMESLGFRTIGLFDSIWWSPICSALRQGAPSAAAYYDAIRVVHRGDMYVDALRYELLHAVSEVDADVLIVDGVFDGVLRLHMHDVLPAHCKLMRLYTHLPYRAICEEDRSWRRGPIVFLSPKEFELPELVYREAVYTEGACFAESATATGSSVALDRASSNIVYCSLGSQIGRYPDAERCLREVVSAASLLGAFHMVVNAGVLKPRLEKFATANVSIVARAHHNEILQRSSVMVLHGGFGTVKDCIWSTVPMLILPQRWDQPLNARRILRHGLGLVLERRDVESNAIADSIEFLHKDATIAGNLKQMRDFFMQADSRNPTAAFVERILDCSFTSSIEPRRLEG